MIKKTRKDKLEKKLKYIKINRSDYYKLVKKVNLLTNRNKVLIDQNKKYEKDTIELKYELDNYKNTLKDNNMEYDKCKKYENYDTEYRQGSYEINNNGFIDKEKSLECELEDMEDELYEENNSINGNISDNIVYKSCERDYDNNSITSNTINYSIETSSNNKKHRKGYNKIDNDEENLKVLNRLRKNNLNLNKYKDDGSLFSDIIANNRNTLKLFNDLYIKIKNNEISSDIYEIYDKNKSRFIKNLEISYKIYNSKVINSNLVFPLYTFNSIKKTSIDNFIKLIEEII